MMAIRRAWRYLNCFCVANKGVMTRKRAVIPLGVVTCASDKVISVHRALVTRTMKPCLANSVISLHHHCLSHGGYDFLAEVSVGSSLKYKIREKLGHMFL